MLSSKLTNSLNNFESICSDDLIRLIFSDKVLSFLISSRLAVLSVGDKLERDSLNEFAFCSYVSLNSFNPFSLVANVKRSFVRRGFTCDIAVCISAILWLESL